MPASCSGAMRTTWGAFKSLGVTSGQDRSFRTASRTVGYAGDAGGANLQGLNCYPARSAATPTGYRALAGLQAVSRGSHPKVEHAASPQPSRCAEPRRSQSLPCECQGRGASALRRPYPHPSSLRAAGEAIQKQHVRPLVCFASLAMTEDANTAPPPHRPPCPAAGPAPPRARARSPAPARRTRPRRDRGRLPRSRDRRRSHPTQSRSGGRRSS